MIHNLKTWPKYFKLMESGQKNFELRLNDRNFEIGDEIILEEFYPETNSYSGKSLNKKITYVLKGEPAENFGLKSGFCILALED